MAARAPGRAGIRERRPVKSAEGGGVLLVAAGVPGPERKIAALIRASTADGWTAGAVGVIAASRRRAVGARASSPVGDAGCLTMRITVRPALGRWRTCAAPRSPGGESSTVRSEVDQNRPERRRRTHVGVVLVPVVLPLHDAQAHHRLVHLAESGCTTASARVDERLDVDSPSDLWRISRWVVGYVGVVWSAP
jgi:hypothetical protein